MKTKIIITSICVGLAVNSFSQCTVSLSATNTTCFGSCDGAITATPAGGTPPYTYNWAPIGQTTQTITGLCAATYSVTVTDASACIATATVSVTQPLACWDLNGNGINDSAEDVNTDGNWDALDCIVATPGPICIGQSATLCASGGTYYSWSTGATSSCITVSPTATTTYTVIICSDTASITLTVDSFSAGLLLVPDTANPLLWYGYPTVIGAATAWSWDFGDGSYASTPNPSHTYSVAGNYIVCLTVTNGACVSTTCDTTYKLTPSGLMQTLIIVNPLTGIESTQNINDIGMFPNPTSGVFQIASNGLRVTGSEIYNVYGEKVYSSQLAQPTINISDQPDGIYFVQLKTAEGVIAKKIVVQR